MCAPGTAETCSDTRDGAEKEDWIPVIRALVARAVFAGSLSIRCPASVDRAGGRGRAAGARRRVLPGASLRASARVAVSAARGSDQVGYIDANTRAIFGRSYAAEPDALIKELAADEAIAAADTLLLTVPNTLGVEYNAHVLESLLTLVAPGLGWR
jgi:hypothetical protein